MTIAEAKAAEVRGVTAARIAPPIPVRSLLDEFIAAGTELGIELMPWQTFAGRYITATAPDGKWLYPEVALVVARQNGKTSLLKPHILQRLRMGRRILHTAQNRSLPRELFLELSADIAGSDEVKYIRQANGQETIEIHAPTCDRRERCGCKGGKYTLVAPRPGVRGFAVDDVILDEVREQHNFELMAGIKPTLTASRNRQIIYLSNAGDSDSVVLNDLRRRGESSSERLAYLEWSSAPDRPLDDREGWAEANPALGITIQLDTLVDFYADLRDKPGIWETEHLCRWVISMQPRLVADYAWQRGQSTLEEPLRPVMGISMDPSGTRASAVLAWQQSDGSVAIRLDADVTGEPIDVERLGPELNERAIRAGVTDVVFDPWTDTDLARYFRKSRPINGREFAEASSGFVRLIESSRLRWDTSEQIGEDLNWTARKPHESGAWMAVRAKDDRPITAALAAIRASWVASAPKPGAPRIL